jgi:hypothetical protein
MKRQKIIYTVDDPICRCKFISDPNYFDAGFNNSPCVANKGIFENPPDIWRYYPDDFSDKVSNVDLETGLNRLLEE